MDKIFQLQFIFKGRVVRGVGRQRECLLFAKNLPEVMVVSRNEGKVRSIQAGLLVGDRQR